MRLFTPVSDEEALLLVRGAPLVGSLFWVDRPIRDEADEDAVWVEIEVAEDDVAGFERSPDPALGYREFELAPAAAASFRVKLV